MKNSILLSLLKETTQGENSAYLTTCPQTHPLHMGDLCSVPRYAGVACLWWGCMTQYYLTLWDMMYGLTHPVLPEQEVWMGCQLQQRACRKADTEKDIDLDESKIYYLSFAFIKAVSLMLAM